MATEVLYPVLFFIIAFLYASVGQSGGSSYVAFLLLIGFSANETKITSLAMNIIVSFLGCFIFSRFDFRKLKPVLFLLLGAVPFAFITGKIVLPENIYKWFSVSILLLSVVLLHVKQVKKNRTQANSYVLYVFIGICIGSIAGLIGIGGGLLLSPVLIMLGLMDVKSVAAITSMYNLVISLTAFCGYATKLGIHFPAMSVYWFACVALGGIAGAFTGKKYLSEKLLKTILTMLLVVACILMLVSRS